MKKGNISSISLKILADFLLLTVFIILMHANLFVQKDFFLRPGSILLLIVFTCWFVSARMLGLYSDYRLKPFSDEWVVFLKSLGLYTLLLSFITMKMPHEYQLRGVELLAHCSLIFIFIPIQKLAIRLLLKKLKNTESNVRKVLIVGAGNTSMNFYKQYVKNKHFGYKLAGFVDDQDMPSLNGHYLGKTSDLGKVIMKHELDDIIVPLPTSQSVSIEEIVSIGEQQGKRIRLIPDYQILGNNKMFVEQIGSLPIITLRSLPLDSIDNRFVKRVFDFIFATLVIALIFSWLFPIISLIIKLTSKGPVFFKQERWGLNNKTIVCWKFRSMVVDSKDTDAEGKYLQATKNDPRITRFGQFLRKTNIDELPQFFNVFLGSMSVVGPRPHPVPLNISSKDDIENYMMRHWVKPGITGWAQASGYRGETKVPYLMKKRVEHDLYYMENWTFWFDLQIIIQTLVNMVKGEKNAY